MKFSQRIRELRKANNLGPRGLGQAVGVSFTYISKIENEKLDFGKMSYRDIEPLEEGGRGARYGLEFQDHVAVALIDLPRSWPTGRR